MDITQQLAAICSTDPASWLICADLLDECGVEHRFRDLATWKITLHASEEESSFRWQKEAGFRKNEAFSRVISSEYPIAFEAVEALSQQVINVERLLPIEIACTAEPETWIEAGERLDQCGVRNCFRRFRDMTTQTGMTPFVKRQKSPSWRCVWAWGEFTMPADLALNPQHWHYTSYAALKAFSDAMMRTWQFRMRAT